MKGYLLEALQNRHSDFIGFISICLVHIPFNCPSIDQLGTFLLCAKQFSFVWYSGDFLNFFSKYRHRC